MLCIKKQNLLPAGDGVVVSVKVMTVVVDSAVVAVVAMVVASAVVGITGNQSKANNY